MNTWCLHSPKLPVGGRGTVGAGGNDVFVTKLSKLTNDEFSPRKLWGVFLGATVAGEGVSELDSPLKSNGSGLKLPPTT